MRNANRDAQVMAAIALVALLLLAWALFLRPLPTATDSGPTDSGPTGLTTTTVNMPSGRMVECVFARDAGAAGVSIALDCDFGW